MPVNIQRKVLAYITSGSRLLVFRHTQHPEAGIQVPAGKVEQGESLGEAVLREAREESGLQNLQICAYLGADELSVVLSGKPTQIQRHFYHLILDAETPERWIHY